VSEYEVYAIKYAHHARRASENFIGGDPHDGPMPLDFFVWLIRGDGREIVVGIFGQVARGAVADLEIERVALGAVHQIVAVLPPGGDASPAGRRDALRHRPPHG